MLVKALLLLVEHWLERLFQSLSVSNIVQRPHFLPFVRWNDSSNCTNDNTGDITFMHLADAIIQSDLKGILTLLLLAISGIEAINFVLQTQ